MEFKIGLVGAGYLGNYYAQKVTAATNITLVGIQDIKAENGQQLAKQYNTTFYQNLEELLPKVSAIICSANTPAHFSIVKMALEAGKDVLVEKPLCLHLEEAQLLVQLAKKNNLLLQVGHVERYNPAYVFLKNHHVAPKYFAVDRLSTFKPRGMDNSVIYDLMIHDIDLVLDLIGEELIDIKANGVKVVSSYFDIVNARLEFKGGAVASLTTSRLSLNNQRKFRVFQKDCYFSLDLANKSVDCYEIKQKNHTQENGMPFAPLPDGRQIQYHRPTVTEADQLSDQLIDFVDCCIHRRQPAASGNNALMTLTCVKKIESLCEDNLAVQLK